MIHPLCRMALGALALTLLAGVAGAHGALTIEQQEHANPWTHLELRNRPENFQFAILPDRTGGQRPGVYDKAIEKLNLLQPEFVLSVGDLIEGYTTDTKSLARQWDDFTSTIAQLQAPFFYVPGNHDLSNSVQAQEWQKRHGRSYYSFLYSDVLFLCLNSEDPQSRLGKEQIDYFARVLKENPEVRWTLVFLHKPLWLDNELCEVPGEYEKSDWQSFARLLKGRNYTVFAGHTHQYSCGVRDGQKHVILATASGVSGLRGIDNYGEFDHITWVTMSDKGPIVANVLIDGVHGENVRTELAARLAGVLLRGPVQGKTYFVEEKRVREIPTQLRLKNDGDLPLKLQVAFEKGHVLTPEPAELACTLAPRSEQTVDVRLRPATEIDASELSSPVGFRWKGSYEPAGERKIEVEGRGSVGIDAKFDCVRRTSPVKVDGKLDEWHALPVTCQAPDAPESGWNGPKDLSYRFAAEYDDDYLYLAVEAKDDKSVYLPDKYTWEQDGVEIRVDARRDPMRSRGRGENEMSDFLAILLTPGETAEQTAIHFADRMPPEVKYASLRTPTGHTSEVAIPVAWLNAHQRGEWQALRINVTVDDCDDPSATVARLLWWRPDWRSTASYEGSGTFVRK